MIFWGYCKWKMSWFVLNNIIHIFRLNTKPVARMAGKTAMERIKANAEVAKKTIDELKTEVSSYY